MTDRQKKTPEQRAQEALGTAERVRERNLEKLAEARTLVRALEAEAEKLDARLAYVGIHPDLTQEERDRVANILNPPPELGDPSPEDPDADA